MVIYYKNTVQKGGRRGLLSATMLVAALLVLDVVTGGAVRAQVRFAGAVGTRVLASAGDSIGHGVAFFFHSPLRAQNQALTAELARLSERAGKADALQQENDELRALVDLTQISPGITAPVISSLNASAYGTFIIGVGTGTSIARGDIVLTEGGFVVGRISDIGENTALVAEALAPGASFEGKLNGASVLIEGQGGGNGRADAPRGLAVAVGDVVVSPQFGEHPIGIVGAVASSSASASQSVYVRLPAGLSSIQFVYVASSGT